MAKKKLIKSKAVSKGKAKTTIKTRIKARIKKQVKVKAKVKTKILAKRSMKTKSQVKVPVKIKNATKPNKINKTNKNNSKVKIQQMNINRSAALGPFGVKPYRISKGETYMNEQQLEHIKKILLQWKAQLMQEVDRTMQHMQDEAANYPDPVDRASQEEEFSVELRTRDRERKLLKKIEVTLNRIKDRDYGYCDDCGAEIGLRRLEARPTATQCIECKTISELREKQTGEGN
jgi:DnaK suppressor protein